MISLLLGLLMAAVGVSQAKPRPKILIVGAEAPAETGAASSRKALSTRAPLVVEVDGAGKVVTRRPRGLFQDIEARRDRKMERARVVDIRQWRPREERGDRPERDAELVGLASFYGGGDGFHGKPTANGEIFDEEALTAAHRSLPFGTWVQVENLGNGKTVLVRINDRGPFAKERVIDLSFKAARLLDMVEDGVIPVRLTVVKRP